MSGKKVLLAVGLGLFASSALMGSSKDTAASKPGGGTPPGPPGGLPFGGPDYKPPTGTAGGVVKVSLGAGDGLVWASSLPQGNPTLARDKAIFAAVTSGMANASWSDLVMRHPALPGYELKLTVMGRVLRIGKQNPVRVTVRYDTMQQIAFYYGSMMMTSAILSEIYRVGAKLAPTMMANQWAGSPGDNSMGETRRMVEYSQMIDKKLPRDFTGICENEGKHWVVSRRLWSDPVNGRGWDDEKNRKPPGPWSANFGWFKEDGSVWQSVGLTHNFAHVDYSQQVKLVRTACVLNGVTVHLGQVLADPKLHRLVSSEGMLPGWVHPAFGESKLPPLPAIPPMGSV